MLKIQGLFQRLKVPFNSNRLPGHHMIMIADSRCHCNPPKSRMFARSALYQQQELTQPDSAAATADATMLILPSYQRTCRPCWGAWSHSCPASAKGHSLPRSQWAGGRREVHRLGPERQDVQKLAKGERQAPPSVAEAPGRAEQTVAPAPAVMRHLSAAVQGQEV